MWVCASEWVCDPNGIGMHDIQTWSKTGGGMRLKWNNQHIDACRHLRRCQAHSNLTQITGSHVSVSIFYCSFIRFMHSMQQRTPDFFFESEITKRAEERKTKAKIFEKRIKANFSFNFPSLLISLVDFFLDDFISVARATGPDQLRWLKIIKKLQLCPVIATEMIISAVEVLATNLINVNVVWFHRNRSGEIISFFFRYEIRPIVSWFLPIYLQNGFFRQEQLENTWCFTCIFFFLFSFERFPYRNLFGYIRQ